MAKDPLLTIRDRGRLAWYGFRSPLPSYVIAAESLWVLWREQFLAECGKREIARFIGGFIGGADRDSARTAGFIGRSGRI